MVGVNCADKAWRQGLQQVHRHLHQHGVGHPKVAVGIRPLAA